MYTIGIHKFPSKEIAYQWLFSNKRGDEISFSNSNVGIRVFQWGKDFAGTVGIGFSKVRVKLVHDRDSRQIKVYFPHNELDEIVPLERSCHVGYARVDVDGKVRFWPIE